MDFFDRGSNTVKTKDLVKNKIIVLIIAVLLVIAIAIFMVRKAISTPKDPAQLAVQILQAPTPMTALGRTYLVYELYLTNFQKEPLTLTSLEVSGTESNDQKFNFSKEDLAALIHPIGDHKDPNQSPLTIDPGVTTMVFLWLPFANEAAIPGQLIHSIAFSTQQRTKKNQSLTVSTDPEPIKKAEPLVLNAPLQGDYWFAGNGPSNTSLHREANTVINGHDYFAQRYAIDFIQLDKDGASFQGDEHKNENYYDYNKEVLAAGAGTVVKVIDDIPENTPHSDKMAVNINIETVCGNHVLVDMGNSNYALYAHLIPGSIKVKVGDRVTAGQVLGKLGNSGNSTEPHLHFQVVDKPSALGANGIPYAFNDFDVHPSRMVKMNGDTNATKVQLLGDTLNHYTNQLMLENTVVRFEG